MTETALSVEMRWFRRGDPGEVEGWFAARGAKREKVRDDRYLVLPGADDLGLKQRVPEGAPTKLELKRRVAELGVVRCAPGVLGHLAQWMKWSVAGELEVAPDDARWVVVRKDRVVRKLALDCAGAVREVDAAEKVPAGCNVELTTLATGEERWWTIGLEAFDERGGDLRDTLVRAASAVLARPGAPSLGLEASFDYPRFVQLVAARAR
jgi:hypothetical protein